MCLELEAIFHVYNICPFFSGCWFEAHVAYSHHDVLCPQDGIGFTESCFMNLPKSLHYLIIIMKLTCWIGIYKVKDLGL
jgi:hypothetical protein